MSISDWDSDLCSSGLRRAGGARLCAAADRPRVAEGEQFAAAGRQALPPRRDRAARRKLCRPGGRARSAPRGARPDRGRPGGGVPAAASDRLLPPLCRRDSAAARSEEHTSELQSLMRISYAVFCLKKTTKLYTAQKTNTHQ